MIRRFIDKLRGRAKPKKAASGDGDWRCVHIFEEWDATETKWGGGHGSGVSETKWGGAIVDFNGMTLKEGLSILREGRRSMTIPRNRVYASESILVCCDCGKLGNRAYQLKSGKLLCWECADG